RRDRRVHDHLGAEVAGGGVPGADAQHAVGPAGRQRVAVGLGHDEHGLESERLAGLDDAHRDLAAVGHEHPLCRHQPSSGRIAKRTWSYSTSAPLAAQMSVTVPLTSAWTEFMSFITSMMQRTVPGSTRSPTSTNGASPGFSAR